MSGALTALGSVLVGAAGPPFTPADLPELKFWYDMSALTGSNGDPQATITDLSGQGFTLTQSGAPQALLATAAVNGLNALRFDGSNDYYLTAFSFTTANAWTVVAIYAKPSAGGAATNQRILSAPGTSADYVNGLIISEPTDATYSAKGIISEYASSVPTHLGLGQEINVGGGTSAASFFGGDLCEIFGSRSAYSAGEKTSIRAYALAKWGVTIP